MEETLVFIDAGFISKLSRYFGGGKYLSYDIIKFTGLLADKIELIPKRIYYYTAPPFQSNNPSLEERNRKDKYDSFIKKLSENPKVVIREGRCQKLNKNSLISYGQKAVDPLMIIDLMSVPLKFSFIKKIILIACDSDFVPAIEELKTYKNLLEKK